jgi:hypothetical protein
VIWIQINVLTARNAVLHAQATHPVRALLMDVQLVIRQRRSVSRTNVGKNVSTMRHVLALQIDVYLVIRQQRNVFNANALRRASKIQTVSLAVV